jgi:hypothetical protein
MPIESREQKVMKSRFYLSAVRLTAMCDGRARWVEAAASGFPGLVERPADGPAGTPNKGDL